MDFADSAVFLESIVTDIVEKALNKAEPTASNPKSNWKKVKNVVL